MCCGFGDDFYRDGERWGRERFGELFSAEPEKRNIIFTAELCVLRPFALDNGEKSEKCNLSISETCFEGGKSGTPECE